MTTALNHVRYLSRTQSAAARFNPRSISRLNLWLKADAIPGLASDAGVAFWADQSGANNHALQATAAAQPLYVPGVMGGHPVVRGDGTDDFLTVTNHDSLTAGLGGYSIYAVLATRSNLSASEFVLEKAGASVDGYEIFLDSSEVAHSRVGAIEPVSPPLTVGRPTVLGVSMERTSNSRYSLNGSVATMSIAAESARNLNNGSPLFLFKRNAGNFWDGDLAELLLYTKSLTTPECKQVEQYLGAKYAIPVV